MFRIFGIKYGVALNSIRNNFNRNREMIVVHGLMGSAKNFRSITKNNAISNYVNSTMIDCRNHGDSPHTETNTIEDLADDLLEFINKQRSDSASTSWDRLVLMGHSMGGEAVMKFTEKYPSMQKYVQRVIIVDIPCSPARTQINWSKTGQMLQNMLDIDLNQSIEQVYREIQKRATSPDVAGLMKGNLVHNDDQTLSWRPNLKTIVKYYDSIGSFNLHENSWRNPVDLIYGELSHYIDDKQIQMYQKLYPQMSLADNFHKIANAGHWVHYDQTLSFLKVTEEILKRDA